ncbi:MAG: Galactokinase [Verrucomicrobiota bacterium]|jgi:L-arabinokinase
MARVIGEAPGRLDFMGGVADYSGALVLEMPLKLTTRVTITETACPEYVFVSKAEGACTLAPGTDPAEAPKWVRYPYGCLWLFSAAQRWRPRGGLRFEVTSRVPESMGVSSSAALEVATLRALEKISGRAFTGTKLARLAQRAENEIVGAPCGLMDQLASAYGVRGALLPILCRPDILGEPVKLPPGVIAVGWPSGVKHAVSDSPYATARAGAFMGRKLIEVGTGRKLAHAAELAPSEVRALSANVLPETITGRAFLQRCGGVDDPLSKIEARRAYAVRASVNFPVEENHRSHLAVALLRGDKARHRTDTLATLGELLYQSHAGYSSIGLGCPETDEMVAGVRRLGPGKGFYGARVSGGGSGGTVVLLLRRDALPALRQLARRLRRPDTLVY